MTVAGQPGGSREPEYPQSTGVPLGVRATAAVPPPPAPAAPAATAPQVVGATDAVATAPGAVPAAPARAAVPATAPPSGPPIAEPAPGGPPQSQRRWRARRHRRLHGLRIGAHGASLELLDQLQLRRESVGLLLGRGHSGEPVTVRLFQPRPVRVMLIGDPWAARLITFRALRFGARAVVLTLEPAGWIDLGRRATSRTDRMAVLAPDAEVHTVASPDTPVLRVVPSAATAGGALPDWSTLLTLLPASTVTDLAIRPDRASQLTSSDLVLTQRLDPSQAAIVASVLGLGARSQEVLPTLPDGVLAVASPTGVRYAWVSPTSAEREALARSQ